MRRTATFVICGFIAGIGTGRAQTPPTLPLQLTLDDAIARGLATSHRLAEAAANADSAVAIAGEQRAATLPQVVAQAGYTRTNHVQPFGPFASGPNEVQFLYPDVPDNYRTRLDVQWPIYTGGRSQALERAARAEAGAAAEDVQAARADLRLEITRAYWALVTAIESARVVDESLKSVEAHVRDVKNQFAVGLLPPNDVAASEAQASHEQMLTIQVKTTRNTAELELARLIGEPSGTALAPTVTLAPPAAPAATPDELVADAKRQRSERAALVKRVDAARERSQAASAGDKPTAAVGGGFDYANPNPRIFPREAAWKTSWDASINVNWPLFDGGRARSEIASAVAQKRAADERLADFDESLATEVKQRAAELSSSDAAISAADAAVRSALEARRVVGDRFGAGVATNTDVIESEAAVLQAGLDRTLAIATARLAEARLARAVGRN